jgi:PKD repeat protein
MWNRGVQPHATRSARPSQARRRRWFADRGQQSLGQSLVEFALVLPVMLLLTLIAVDFGRIYLGWISLQNMARAASNFAANHSDAWVTPLTPKHAAIIVQYRNQVLNDAAATNCVLTPAVPADPTFRDGNGDPSTTGIGDRASAAFTCTFSVITPLISSIVGNAIPVSAAAVFPVKSGQFAVANGGTAPVANFTASPTTTTTGTNVAFTDTSTGTPTTWAWTFGDGGTSSVQHPTHPYAAAGSYTVTLTVTNGNGSSYFERLGYIAVSAPAPVANFTASTTTPTLGQTVTFTDTSSGSPTGWAWTFGDGGSINTGPTASHAYNTAGSYTVTLTVTSASGSSQVTKLNYIVVAAATCTVPSFFGTSSSNAQATWNAAHFTTTVQFQQGNLPWTINSQNVVAASSVPCNTAITVSKN